MKKVITLISACSLLSCFVNADVYKYKNKVYPTLNEAKQAFESKYIKTYLYNTESWVNKHGEFKKKYRFYGITDYCFYNKIGLNGFGYSGTLTGICADTPSEVIPKTIERSKLNCKNHPGFSPQILSFELTSNKFSFDIPRYGYEASINYAGSANRECTALNPPSEEKTVSVGTKGKWESIEVVKENIKEMGKTCKAAGNPINLAIGNKFQVVNDFIGSESFPLRLTRTYNSYTGEWSFNYTQSIATGSRYISATHEDGKTLIFKTHNAYRGDPDIFNKIEPIIDGTGNRQGWKYTKINNTVETYNRINKLSSITDLNTDLTQVITYKGKSIIVTTPTGQTLSLSLNNQKQVIRAQHKGSVWSYDYSEAGSLETVTYPNGKSTHYHYENKQYPRALTGITDENGVRFATWAYDDQGRAISSEHAGGKEKVSLEFHDNNSTTVTNPLGKKTTYHFQQFNGVNKVVKVEGHQSTNCAAANKEYSYYPNGLLKTKTDWKGNTTEYKYNDQGLQVEKTEAVGTPQARTTTTEWDVEKRLPLKASDGLLETQYQYDEKGKLTSKKQVKVSQPPEK